MKSIVLSVKESDNKEYRRGKKENEFRQSIRI